MISLSGGHHRGRVLLSARFPLYLTHRTTSGSAGLKQKPERVVSKGCKDKLGRI